jgi:hypothetical protein
MPPDKLCSLVVEFPPLWDGVEVPKTTTIPISGKAFYTAEVLDPHARVYPVRGGYGRGEISRESSKAGLVQLHDHL